MIKDNILEQTTCRKFLGVYIDDKLKWNQHLNHIAGKMSRNLGLIGRVSRILPSDTLHILYYSLIYPHLLYCCIIWGAACATSLHKLKVLQNRAVRLITRASFRASFSPIFKQLYILKLIDIHRLQIAMFMFGSNHPVYRTAAWCIVR